MSDKNAETPLRKLRNLHIENVQNQSTPLKIPSSPFLKTLGYGTGVQVYRLDRSPRGGQIRSPWAIKRTINAVNKKRNMSVINERLEKEIEVLKTLNHPNIVGYRHDVSSKDNERSLALELCHTSLANVLEERYSENLGPMPAHQILKMIKHIASALDYLHTEAKILHGDVKSGNILISGEFDVCKLCDFGVTIPLDENGEVNFVKNPELCYTGTDAWTAPEIFDGAEIIDASVDIFSLGLVIYETLALVPPHSLDYNGGNLSAAERICEIDESMNTIDLSFESNDAKAENSEASKFTEPTEEAAENTSFESETDDEEDNKENLENDAFYAALGTRPPLPTAFQLSDDYNRVVELFYCCTNALSEDRPSAKTIWQSIGDDDIKNK